MHVKVRDTLKDTLCRAYRAIGGLARHWEDHDVLDHWMFSTLSGRQVMMSRWRPRRGDRVEIQKWKF